MCRKQVRVAQRPRDFGIWVEPVSGWGPISVGLGGFTEQPLPEDRGPLSTPPSSQLRPELAF